MNENDINILLDHFVDGLDASESASVIQKINTRPAWSDAYQKISRVFGSLSTVREQNSQQPVPVGLANKTFQKILDLENAKKSNTAYFAQKESVKSVDVNAVSSNSHKANSGMNFSFLALCACAGFLLVVTPATWFFTSSHSVANHSTTEIPTSVAKSDSVQPSMLSQKSANYDVEFALTGYARNSNSSSHFFNPNSTSCTATVTNCSVIDSQAMVNAPNKLVCLNNADSSNVAPVYKPVSSKIVCPDGCAVFASKTDGQPIIIVSSPSASSNLLKEQNLIQNTGFESEHISTPVFYQH